RLVGGDELGIALRLQARPPGRVRNDAVRQWADRAVELRLGRADRLGEELRRETHALQGLREADRVGVIAAGDYHVGIAVLDGERDGREIGLRQGIGRVVDHRHAEFVRLLLTRLAASERIGRLQGQYPTFLAPWLFASGNMPSR